MLISGAAQEVPVEIHHRFHDSICRANDIRGVVGETLTAEDAYAVGRGVATMVLRNGGESVAVGRDGRESSPALYEAAVAGALDAGATIWRIGVGPSPMLYFAVHHLKAGGGIMVTGSHNPKGFNGFKLMCGTKSFTADMMGELTAIAESGGFATGVGTPVECAIIDTYVSALVQATGAIGERRCAWDPGNGAIGEVLEKVLISLPGHHYAINTTIDGTFPAHHPDPSDPGNLAQLKDLVLARNCDIGFAFDGDGDRLGVIDRNGRIVWPDQYLALLVNGVVAKNPGATIISDVKASDVLFDYIRDAGGTPEMWKTGHSLVKGRMRELNAPLAGEMSGHIFFADRWFGFDDALYAALRLLEALETEGTEIDDFLDSLPSPVNTPEIRLACEDERKFGVIESVAKIVAERGDEAISVDGVRVAEGSGWWLLRASNTEPALVARCEAADTDALARIKENLAALVERHDVDPGALRAPVATDS